MNPFQALLRYTLRDDDDIETVERKRLVLIVSLASAVFGVPFGLESLQSGAQLNYLCFLWIAAFNGLALLIYQLAARSMPRVLVERSCVLLTAAVICGDWSNAAAVQSARVWSFAILLMDTLLTIGGSRCVQDICLHGTAVWLVVSAVEDGWRLGLYDIPAWSERYPDAASVADLQCANPPCAVGLVSATSKVFVYLFGLYIDFVATRGFAEGQRREKEKIMLIVRVAEQVAGCLAQFDLAAAGSALDTAGADGLSAELAASFRRLLANLNGYRPYLPQSCFESQEAAEEDSEQTMHREASSSGSAYGKTAAVLSASGTIPLARSRKSSRAGSPLPSHLGSPSAFRASLSVSIGKESLGGSRHLARSCSADTASPPCSDGRAASSEDLPSPAVFPTEGTPARRRSATPRQAHTPHQARLTLLHCNRSGMLAALAQGGMQHADLSSWMAAEVGRFCAKVLAQRGVVDLLSADHLHANFGVLRNLGAHRMAAVRCAHSICSSAPDRLSLQEVQSDDDAGAAGLGALPVTSAVCTGVAVCGDFGSDAARRFMVLGGVSSFMVVAERIAAGWDVDVLTDSEVQSDAQMLWDLRLRKMVIFPKISPRPAGLWELCDAKLEGKKASQTEWMYELNAAPPNPWAPYNTAVVQWCMHGAEAALAVVDAADTPQSAAVDDALAALRAALAVSEPGSAAGPPLCAVPAAAGVGDPAPLAAAQPCAAPPAAALAPAWGPEARE
eukprot:TRINITY_DN51146_c0_g1_i1.p1 TRINITY_DN51146_c0_g1~~TRINITY_DN51146_c0_g1_i1.p1  ORF type:complete len:752 (+),score=193.17 TRINITY_DN51146_c0_g1_i1:62-2257(+)